MTLDVYTGGQRLPLKDPKAYISGGRQDVNIIYGYSGGQRYIVWQRQHLEISTSGLGWDRITLTWTGSDAELFKVYRSGVSSPVYSGTAKTFTDIGLWPSTAYTWTVQAVTGGVVVDSKTTASITTPSRVDLGLQASAVSWNQIHLTWTDASGGGIDQYFLQRAGTNGVYLAAGTKSYTDSGLNASTGYSYTLQARRGGVVVPPTDSASASTPARPVVNKSVTLNATWIETWRGNAAYRTDNSNIYHGYDSYVGPGYYRSLARFEIPGDVRNCLSVTYVRMYWRNIHTYNSTGATYRMGYHTYNSKPPSGSFPGTIYKFDQAVKKESVVGTAATYVNRDVTSYFAEALRTGGMWGLAWGPGNTTSVSQYGYAAASPMQLEIHWTVPG